MASDNGHLMAFWLFKSEPFKFSFEDLKHSDQQTTTWDGIRNYQARNFMRDQAKQGDLVLFYHSRVDPPGVVGVAEITKEAYPDYTAWDPKSDYFDPKSSAENPRWLMVEVTYKYDFKSIVTLQDMKQDKALEGMLVIKRGQRLSIQPVEKKHFDRVCAMGGVA